MAPLRFEATLFRPGPTEKVGSGLLLRIPRSASMELPSRGMTPVRGTLSGVAFQAVLEPDGQGSHWFRPDGGLLEATGHREGDTVALELEPAETWWEPKAPSDLQEALAADRAAQEPWLDITPAARWDWIRWIGAARREETRKKRVAAACDMLKSGKRRPCCFDRSQCTLTDA